ncbi:MAG: leucine-rich repeat domain-containing protein [Spirochaetales bacterium]|nr:leucine-rich repeat domain-containing protein [Spirochaetales bacterium]
MKEKDRYIVFSIVLFVEILALMIFIYCEGDMWIKKILCNLECVTIGIFLILFPVVVGISIIAKSCSYTGDTVHISKEDLHYRCNFESAKEIYIAKDVTNIPYKHFFGLKKLQNVVFEGENTVIGENAFEKCKNLERVYLPKKLQEIKDETFENCEKLKKITIPKSVTRIGAGVFNGCKNLTKFDVESGNPSYLPSEDGKILYDRAKTELLAYPSATEEVKICEKIESIGRYAFFNCKNLTSLEIPDSVTKVSGSAFIGCKKLETLIIGDGLTLLKKLPIIPSLKLIRIGKDIKKINDNVFFDCCILKNITIGDCVTSIGNNAFEECDNLTTVTIGSEVEEIRAGAFKDCKKLEEITIPDSVTRIGTGAFSGCKGLTNITIGNGVKEIEKDTFSGCKKLETLVIGDGLTSLDNLPITKALKSITIGSGVTKIGAGAFKDCKKLKCVTFEGEGTWMYTDKNDYTGGDKVDELSDSKKNAKKLRKTHCNKYWYKATN